jgi:hypothetical protein
VNGSITSSSQSSPVRATRKLAHKPLHCAKVSQQAPKNASQICGSSSGAQYAAMAVRH